MKRYFGLEQARAESSAELSRVATVGFFDGVHLGHVRVLEVLSEWARDVDAEPVVVTFERHPQTVLGSKARLGSHPPVPVVSLDHRLMLLERYGVAATLVLPFDRELASWSPERFVEEALQGALGVQRLLMGYDGGFGKARRGDYEYLSQREDELQLEVRRSEELEVGGRPISSTRIRAALQAADLDEVERLLGRKFSLIGRVIHGFERGREIGFPTANLDLGESVLLPRGVYMVTARSVGGDVHAPQQGPSYSAVMNVGVSPTFESANRSGEPDRQGGESEVSQVFDAARDRVEVHLIDFVGDLYGQVLEVSVESLHREEIRFDSVDALVAQITEDVAARRRA